MYSIPVNITLENLNIGDTYNIKLNGQDVSSIYPTGLSFFAYKPSQNFSIVVNKEENKLALINIVSTNNRTRIVDSSSIFLKCNHETICNIDLSDPGRPTFETVYPTPTPTKTPTLTPTPTSTEMNETPTPTPTSTRENELPIVNSANFSSCADWNGQDGNVTTVGTNGGASAYGAFDMSGNLYEWNDLTGAAGSSRGLRGGYWYGSAFNLSSLDRHTTTPTEESHSIGFRIVTTGNSLLHNFVTVGDTSNSNDTTGYGEVNYIYQIGKYPITNCEYAEFLNAVAIIDDYNVYSTDMASDDRGGIIRGGNPGSYSYIVKTNMENKPVNFISWFKAARYCNWLHNNKPTNIGYQNSSTTESGAYSLNGAIGPNIVEKNSNAKYHIPTENEWYKAAYYSPIKDGVGGYYLYATQSDIEPTCVTANSVGDGTARTSDYTCSIIAVPTPTPTLTPTPTESIYLFNAGVCSVTPPDWGSSGVLFDFSPRTNKIFTIQGVTFNAIGGALWWNDTPPEFDPPNTHILYSTPTTFPTTSNTRRLNFIFNPLTGGLGSLVIASEISAFSVSKNNNIVAYTVASIITDCDDNPGLIGSNISFIYTVDVDSGNPQITEQAFCLINTNNDNTQNRFLRNISITINSATLLLP